MADSLERIGNITEMVRGGVAARRGPMPAQWADHSGESTQPHCVRLFRSESCRRRTRTRRCGTARRWPFGASPRVPNTAHRAPPSMFQVTLMISDCVGGPGRYFMEDGKLNVCLRALVAAKEAQWRMLATDESVTVRITQNSALSLPCAGQPVAIRSSGPGSVTCPRVTDSSCPPSAGDEGEDAKVRDRRRADPEERVGPRGGGASASSVPVAGCAVLLVLTILTVALADHGPPPPPRAHRQRAGAHSVRHLTGALGEHAGTGSRGRRRVCGWRHLLMPMPCLCLCTRRLSAHPSSLPPPVSV